MGRSAAARRQRARREQDKNKPASAAWRERMGMKPVSRTKKDHINPRTGKPYSQSPGKPGTEPKDPPKPSRTPPKTDSKPPSRSSSRTRTPQSKDMDANYKAWAKANPTLAKKVKKGQAGYKAIKGSGSKPPVNAGASNGAPGAQSRPSTSNQPRRAGAGNGAPGAQSAKKPSKKTTGKKGDTKRLRDALKAVKKYKPKK